MGFHQNDKGPSTNTQCIPGQGIARTERSVQIGWVSRSYSPSKKSVSDRRNGRCQQPIARRAGWHGIPMTGASSGPNSVAVADRRVMLRAPPTDESGSGPVDGIRPRRQRTSCPASSVVRWPRGRKSGPGRRRSEPGHRVGETRRGPGGGETVLKPPDGQFEREKPPKPPYGGRGDAMEARGGQSIE